MNERLPAATRISQRFDRLIAWMTALERPTARAIAAGTTALLCLSQVLLGAHVSLTALALVPITFTAWTLGTRAGLLAAGALAAVAVLVTGASPAFAPHAEAHGVAAGWNIAMRIFASLFNVMLVSGFRRTFNIERWRARHDGLTGAVNKQVFMHHLETEMAGLAEGALVLAYLDLDGFKQVNDRFGHQTGDEVLARFASGASAILRPDDCFARFGGDEFVVLAHAPSIEAGVRGIESIHARLTALLRALPYGVTCSTGAVLLQPGHDLARTAFVGLADELMYEVKRSGRNALRIALAASDDDDERRAA